MLFTARLIFLFALALPAWAVTHHVCATGAGGATSDGTSQANCCDGPGDASCAPSSGDTWKLYGRWDADDTFGAVGGVTYQCQPGNTLVSERRIGSGVGFSSLGVYGAGAYNWTLVDSGKSIYRITYGGILSWLKVDGVSYTPIVHYSNTEAQVFQTLQPGQFTMRTGNPRLMYLRLLDGGNPEHRTVTVNAMDSTAAGYITLSSDSNVAIDGCDISGHIAEFAYAGVSATSSPGLVITNSSLHGNLLGVAIDGGSLRFSRSSASGNLGTGIIASGVDSTLTGLLVDDHSHLDENGVDPYYSGANLSYSQDGDGLGVGAGGGTVIYVGVFDSTMSRNGPRKVVRPDVTAPTITGAGFTSSTSNPMTVEAVDIVGNEVADNFRYALQINYGKKVRVTGNVVRGTFFNETALTVNCSGGATLRIADAVSAGGYRQVYNNVFYENDACSTLFLANDTTNATWDVRDNVFVRNSSALSVPDDRGEIWLNGSNPYTVGGNVFWDSRHYDSDLTPDYYRVVGTESGVIGAGDQVADPKFFGPLDSARGFSPHPDSPLCDSGSLNKAGLYFGGVRLGLRDDIGAFECQSTATLP